MGRTPDAFDGPSFEEAVIWEEQVSDPSVENRTQIVQGKGLMTFTDGVARPIGETREAHWQAPVDALLVNTPPGSPTTGYRVIVGSTPTGAFVGHAGEIAQWIGTAWVLTTPRQGTSAFVKGGDVPYQQTASTAPWVWDKVNPGGHFGTEINHVFGAAYSSTTSSAFQQKVRLTLTDLPLGDYFLVVSAIVSGTKSNTYLEVQIEEDDTTARAVTQFRNSRADAQYTYMSHEVLAAYSGSHTFDLDYRKAGGGGSAGIEEAQITLWRIDE